MMLRCALIILVVISLIPISSYSHAAGEESFTYDDMGMKDPFFPLVDKDGKLTVTHGSIDSVNDIVVEGILYDDDGESVVILNGLVFKENDQVGTIRVERIEEDRVILSAKGRKYTLKLKE